MSIDDDKDDAPDDIHADVAAALDSMEKAEEAPVETEKAETATDGPRSRDEKGRFAKGGAKAEDDAPPAEAAVETPVPEEGAETAKVEGYATEADERRRAAAGWKVGR